MKGFIKTIFRVFLAAICGYGIFDDPFQAFVAFFLIFIALTVDAELNPWTNKE